MDLPPQRLPKEISKSPPRLHTFRNIQRTRAERECLDHLIVFNETRYAVLLVPILTTITNPEPISRWPGFAQPRPIQPVEMGRVVAVPLVGGLHHRYERHAA